MKIISTIFLLFGLLSAANSAQPEATLIIKYPYTNYAVGIRDTASVKINDSEPIIIEPTWGAGDIAQKIVKVPAGIVTIESAHWKRGQANFINKIEVQGGKTYTVVLYVMGFQMWDVMYSAAQEMLIKNLQPPKDTYNNNTIKNQIISIN
jgi:hypothetical protein